MADYTYNKKYKELVEQEGTLKEEILKFLKSVHDSEDIIKKFESIIEIQSKKIDIIDEELNDLEWDKDNELDEKDSEIGDLERKVEDLEDQLENLGIGGSENSLDDVMKLELWQVAKNKFTLTELEEKFGGSRFQIM